MNRRRNAKVLAAVALLACAASVSGCGRTVSGTAQPAGASASVNTKFDKLLRECEAVSMDKIGEAVSKGAFAMPSFYGAVCMWDVQGAAGGDAMVTLNWYEIGSLNNEKTTNDKLGYTTTPVTVQGSRALQTQRPNDPDSCGVSASAPDSGIVGWWINYRAGSSHPDPCAGAKKLVELTLNLAR
ncbi:DUF3558 domain-containing protein [Nocardia sp. NPDC052566]|uniref:DUF3558 domain-containing protein n=1 Tax=Nocardia sp. NPDC052566 TaxID=3364330 RepID=UPI0037C63D9C